jgi:hypothetical protein
MLQAPDEERIYELLKRSTNVAIDETGYDELLTMEPALAAIDVMTYDAEMEALVEELDLAPEDLVPLVERYRSERSAQKR